MSDESQERTGAIWKNKEGLDRQKIFKECKSLPVPNISKTLERYLNAIVTFISPEDYSKTATMVKEFLSDQEGIDQIKSYLEKKAQNETNWAYDWWLQDMYLNNMSALPVVSNPGWVFERLNFSSREQLFAEWGKMIHAMASFKLQLESCKLNLQDDPSLCTQQYYRVLTSYRIPGDGRDQLQTMDPTEVHPTEHILVMSKNYTYLMCIKLSNIWLNRETISSVLLAISDDSSRRPLKAKNQCVSLLTSDDRRNWATARDILKLNPANSENLDSIQKCLFVVCLDDMNHNFTDWSRSQNEMFRQILTGGGAKRNSANRWFDQTIQLIASDDGVCGINYEHSPAEGVAVIRMVKDMMEMSERGDLLNEKDNIDPELHRDKIFKHLDWTLNDEVKRAISRAASAIDKLDEDTDIEVFKFQDYGKTFMKMSKCSPDSFVQIAMQLSYYSLHGTLCATYESASLRRFSLGRVDSIRASHSEALKWTTEMKNELVTKQEKAKLFHQAIREQTKIMKENIFGEGLDIPLLGIRMACKEIWPDKKILLFEDEVLKKACHFKLSTSQVPTGDSKSYMGYGAVVPDGYGVSYNLEDDCIIFCIGSFFSCEETSSVRFAKSLQKALTDIKELLTD